MRVIKIIVIAILLLVIALIIFIELYSLPKEPRWVTEIKNNIDLEECGIENCQACDVNSCYNLNSSCEVESKRYACGPSCDAVIIYCVPKDAII